MNLRRSNRRLRFTVFFLLLVLVASSLPRCRQQPEAYPQDDEPRLREVWSYGRGDTKAVRLPVSGLLARPDGEGLFGPLPDPVETILLQTRAATRDPEVRAILLEVSSPGGSVASSDQIYAALDAFRRSRPDRRVIVFIRDLGASGAYYAAMASDLIVAEPTAIIGSVGVILQTLNVEGLSEKIGITDVTVKSGQNKDLLNPFQPVDAEQTKLLQKLIDDMQERFIGLVATARHLDPDLSPELFDGRIFSAPDALAAGLIDRIGYWEDALDAAEQLLGADGLRVVRYKPERTLISSLLQMRSPQPWPTLRIGSPRFLYLWKP